jgi:sugar lactone lactonase YvrE
MPVVVLAETADRLGEGPCWNAAEQRLYWFDIKQRWLRWREADGTLGAFALPFRASAGAPRRRGGLLMATEAGLATFDPAGSRVELVQPMTFEPGFRSNDGKVDPQGRFWWSTMEDGGGARPGAIHVTEADRTTHRVIEGIHIANATAFSADGATLYLADSQAQAIYAYDTADLTRRRVFARTDGEAAPDGAAMDAEGCLWVAEWGGWRVVRYTGDGTIDRIVEVPVAQPTCCAFGGPALTTLYITSAWDGLSPEARADQPLAGALFAFEPGVAGQPVPAFGG